MVSVVHLVELPQRCFKSVLAWPRCCSMFCTILISLKSTTVVRLLNGRWIVFSYASCFSPLAPCRRFSENLVAQMWYFVKCIYFGLSAYQIRCGYPTRVLGNFLTKSYNYVNLFLFQGWVRQDCVIRHSTSSTAACCWCRAGADNKQEQLFLKEANTYMILLLLLHLFILWSFE